jgi:hypothetical protein
MKITSRILATAAVAGVFGSIVACAQAPTGGEQTGTDQQAQTCLTCGNGSSGGGGSSSGGSSSGGLPTHFIIQLPGPVTCDTGDTCSFTATGTYLDGANGDPISANCTQVYEFVESGPELAHPYDYYVAYCVESASVDNWVSAPYSPLQNPVKYADESYTQRALPAAASGDVYVQFGGTTLGGKCPGGCPVER